MEMKTCWSPLPVKNGSVMLINKDHETARQVSISFVDQSTHRTRHFAEAVERIAFGAAEYQWHEGVGTEYASPDGPASKSTVQSNASGTFELPKASIVVYAATLTVSDVSPRPWQAGERNPYLLSCLIRYLPCSCRPSCRWPAGGDASKIEARIAPHLADAFRYVRIV